MRKLIRYEKRCNSDDRYLVVTVFAAYEATTSFNIEADKRVCKASRPRIEKEQSKKQTHKQEHCLPNYKSWTILKHNPTNLKQDKAILRSLSTLSCPILPIYRYLCYIIP